MQDLTFVVGSDRAAAEIWETLGDAGIALEASCAFPRLEGRIVHIVVGEEDANRAHEALRLAHFLPLDRREVLIADIETKPGELGHLARRIADAGAKVYILYMATGDRVVIGADDLDKVRSVI